MTKYEAIFRRKSVRKYKKAEVDEAVLDKIRSFGQDALGVRPDIRVKWRIYKGCDHKVKGLFQVKAPYYAALYSEVCEDCQINGGCLMEQLVLYLHTQGIGSCYQGGAKLREEEEDGMELLMILAFGYPEEPLERRRADFKRVELRKLVKTGGPVNRQLKILLEPARLAPSALNQQPWRFVAAENKIHLFVRRPGRVGYQRQLGKSMFHAGIVLSHMLIAAEEHWLDLEYQKLGSIMEKAIQNYLYAGSLILSGGGKI